MKNVVIGSALFLALAVSAAGQDSKFKKDPNSVDQERPRTVAGETAEPEEQPILQAGTNLEAKLLSTLDVRKANVGDEVVLKTTDSIKQDGEVLVPKGTKLIGTVTEVTSRSDGNGTSAISIVFDRMENDIFSAPFSASIVSVAKAGSNLAAGDLFANDVSGSSSGTARASRRGSGGGLLGGATGAVGGVLNSTTSTVGSVANTAGNTLGNTVGGASGTLGRTVNGIRISQSGSASANGSTTLSAEGKNLKLNKGTMFRLQMDESVSN